MEYNQRIIHNVLRAVSCTRIKKYEYAIQICKKNASKRGRLLHGVRILTSRINNIFHINL